MLCPKCQTENSQGGKFCINCGVSLATLTPTLPQVPPQAPSATAEVIQVLPPSKSWYEKWYWLLLLILLAGPIGMLIIYFILKKSNLPQGAKTLLAILLGLFFFSLSVFLWGWLLPKQKAKSRVSTPTPSVSRFQAPTATPTPLPLLPKTVIQTVGTEFIGVSAILTEVKRSGSVVTVRFTLKAASSKDQLGQGCGTHETRIVGKDNSEGLYCISSIDKDDPYSLETAFMVDELNQMKYEVLKDANGNYLGSTGVKEILELNQEISLYAQFTAPPETSKSITINFPKVQPFTGVKLE